MRALRAKCVISALALEFLILTAARTSEATAARWEEIDLGAGIWTVSAKPHEVTPVAPCAAQRQGNHNPDGSILPFGRVHLCSPANRKNGSLQGCRVPLCSNSCAT